MGVERARVLILGERITEQRIAEQLKMEKFEPIFLREYFQKPLPPVAGTDSWMEVREMLKTYSQEYPESLIHPGTTLWAERPELVTVGEELGLTVISPPAKILSVFCNKLSLLLEAEQLGISHLILRSDPMNTVREIEEFIQNTDQKFPFVLKAVKGGGSYGVYVVQDEDCLKKKIPLWLEQLRRNLGEVMLFAERYLEGARHIAVPFARFQGGDFQIFPTLDSSLQSRYRKIIEYCPAQKLDQSTHKQIETWTKALADRFNYVGIGVLEFLVDSSRAFLINGLPRLNTSFHLWEEVAGIRAVSWQLATMATMSMDSSDSDFSPELKSENERNHGLSVRILAEDSYLQLPQPGIVSELSSCRQWNFGDTYAELSMNFVQGDSLPISGPGILAILYVFTPNRRQGMHVADNILQEFWAAGSLQTNEKFLIELLNHPWVQEEIFHAGFVDEEFLPYIRPPVECFRLAAAICLSHSEVRAALSEPKGRWIVSEHLISPEEETRNLKWLGEPRYWTSQEKGGQFKHGVSGVVETQTGTLRVCAFPLTVTDPLGARWLVRMGSWFVMVRYAQRQVKKNENLNSTDKPQKKSKLFALVGGRVHAVLFRRGVSVQAHEPLLIVESLGVFVPHSIPVKSKVTQWKIEAEQFVHAGQDLADLDLLV